MLLASRSFHELRNEISAPTYVGGYGRDRVGCRGLRPGTLPHHRTCGFPHPAVERSCLLHGGRKI